MLAQDWYRFCKQGSMFFWKDASFSNDVCFSSIKVGLFWSWFWKEFNPDETTFKSSPGRYLFIILINSSRLMFGMGISEEVPEMPELLFSESCEMLQLVRFWRLFVAGVEAWFWFWILIVDKRRFSVVERKFFCWLKFGEFLIFFEDFVVAFWRFLFLVGPVKIKNFEDEAQ